jgi:Ca2+-binding RTX toxin-like protein
MDMVSLIGAEVLNESAQFALNEATLTTQRLLKAIASDADFLTRVTLAFGDGFDAEKLEGLRQQWAASDFGAIPAIEIRSSSEINGANGAFSADTNTIYLAQEYIARNTSNPQAIADVLLEEIGHSVDSKINVLDAPGDEGAIFSALAQGVQLDEPTLQALKAEDDTAVLTLDEQIIQVEKQDEASQKEIKFTANGTRVHGLAGDVIRVDLKSALSLDERQQLIKGDITAKFDLNDLRKFDNLTDGSIAWGSDGSPISDPGGFENTGVFYFVPNIPFKAHPSELNANSFPSARGTFHVDFSNSVSKDRDLALQIDVKPGYFPFQLSDSVGEGGANNPLDVYRVQQRLKYLGFPSFGPDPFVDSEGKKQYPRGQTLNVNGRLEPVQGKTRSTTSEAIRLFQAAIYDDVLNPDGNPLRADRGANGRVDVNENSIQWLNATNAPRWVELIDNNGAGGAFDIYRGEDQEERFGTDWVRDITVKATTQAVGTQTITAISEYGYTDQHETHKDGKDVDVDIVEANLQIGTNTITAPTPEERNNPRFNIRNHYLDQLTVTERRVASDILAFYDATGSEGAAQWHTVYVGGDNTINWKNPNTNKYQEVQLQQDANGNYTHNGQIVINANAINNGKQITDILDNENYQKWNPDNAVRIRQVLQALNVRSARSDDHDNHFHVSLKPPERKDFVAPDLAGNTLGNARFIGSLSENPTPNTQRTVAFNDFVGPNDTNDYYRFSLDSTTNVSLVLDGLSANADVKLVKANGQEITNSTLGNTQTETISQTLEKGTYYVQVFQSSNASTNYNLTLKAGEGKDGFGTENTIYERFKFGGKVSDVFGNTGDNKPLSPLPANTNFEATFYQPSTNRSGVYKGRTDANGNTNLGTVILDQFSGSDTDLDGLPDVGEFAIGTNPKRADSDSDRISDALEIEAGTNPLDKTDPGDFIDKVKRFWNNSSKFLDELIGGLDSFLPQLQDGVDSQVYANKLPLLGDLNSLSSSDTSNSISSLRASSLSSSLPPLKFITEIHDAILDKLAEVVTEALNPLREILSDTLGDVLPDREITNDQFKNFLGDLVTQLLVAPSQPTEQYLINSVEQALSKSFDVNVQNIDDKISNFLRDINAELTEQLDGVFSQPFKPVQQALFDAVGPDGINILKDSDDIGIDIGINDIKVDTTDGVKFDLNLGTTKPLLDIPLETDIGLPGLGLSVTGEAEAKFDFNLALGFGVNKTDGFFLDTSKDKELSINLDASLSELTAKGSLGFLQMGVIDKGSKLNAGFSVDLKDPNGDDKLTASELTSLKLTSLKLDTQLSLDADVNLGLATSFGGEAKLPSITSDFNLDWHFEDWSFDKATADPTKTQTLGGDNKPTIAFNNVKLGLGTFFSDFANPVLEKVQTILEPVKPIINYLTTPIGPKGLQITLLEVAQKFTVDDKPVITKDQAEAIESISKLINLIDSIPSNTNNIQIALGSFNLGSADVSNRNFALSSIEIPDPEPDPEVDETKLDNLDNIIPNATNGNNFITELKKIPGEGLKFPILTDPKIAVGLLLGQEVDLFSYKVPKVQFDFVYTSPFFTIVGPLGARFKGNIGVGIDLAFGYDTFGLQQFAANDFKKENLSDIFNGFYVSDNIQKQPDGTPKDLPEVTFNLGLKAFAELNGGVASVGVGGGIDANTYFNLHDDNNDGKIRVDEIIKLIDNPLCLFDTSGEITAGLSAYVKVGFGRFGFKLRYDSPTVTLKQYNFGCDGKGDPNDPTKKPPILATGIAGNELRLNMGRYAGERKYWNTTDGNEVFTVEHKSGSSGSETVIVSAFGVKEEHSGVSKISAEGTEGNDIIELKENDKKETILTPAELQGGNGDDLVAGGSGNDSLYGGAGNDLLIGGAGADYFDGGGADTVSGGDGVDTVSYETAKTGILLNLTKPEENTGDAKGDTFNLESIEQYQGSQFDDTLIGDENDNLLAGLGGNDSLEGGAGNDVLDGGDGNDTLRGGDGNDTLSGGAGADILDGGQGQDFVSYATASSGILINLLTNVHTGDAAGDVFVPKSIEEIEGSAYADTLIGDTDNNILRGGAGNDTLEGGEGDDTLIGSDPPPEDEEIKKLLQNVQHDDRLIGGAGADKLYGGEGKDTLIGGAGADILDGGEGKDIASYETATTAVSINLATGVHTGDAAGDVFESIEEYEGSSYDDTLSGDNNNNIFSGADGNDTLVGGGGADTLRGGQGNDTYELDAQTAAGSKIQDSGGSNDILNLSNITLSLSPLESGKAGLARNGNALIIDINKDGVANQAEDLTIEDFFSPRNFSINDVTVTEGNDGITNAVFTVSATSGAGSGGAGFIEAVGNLLGTDILTNEDLKTVTVDYATADDTAKKNEDYNTTTGKLQFNESETEKTITVPIKIDTSVERDETFFVNLSNASNTDIADNQGVGKILNDDFPVVNFGAPSYSRTEEDTVTVVNIPVTLSETPLTDVTVPIAIDPSSTATLGASKDYTLSATSLTFKAGATGAALTQNVAVTIKLDNIAENAETVVLNLGTLTGAIAGTTATTTLTIEANDPIAYSISAGSATITERNSGSTPISFTVSRSGGTDAASSIDYAIGGTATNESDYKNIGGTSGAKSTTGTINFAAGQTSKTITLDVVGDTVIEANEEITVTLSNPVAPGPTPTITTPTATTAIVNNDFPVVNFGAPSYDSTEGNSETIVNIPVTLSETPLTDVTVAIAINNSSTATLGESNDYTLSTTSLTFKAGATGADLVQNVALTIKPDNIAENAETVVLNLGTITGAKAGTTTATTLTIEANDPIAYAISAGTVSITEGNSGSTPISFTVSRSGGTDAASSINYAIGGTADDLDYNNIGGTSGATSPTGTINFAAGETSKTITLDVLGDTLIEANEAITVTLSNPIAPGPTPTLTTQTATTTIVNDDVPQPSFTTASNFVATSSLRNLAVGDFNKDGKLDVATASTGPNNVSVLLGNGTGSLGTATQLSTPQAINTWAVAVGDFNGDGFSDLATANNGSSNVSIRLGTGTGSFSAASNFSVGSNPYSVAVGDFNKDGKLDLVTANQSANNVSILLGTGTGSFSAASNFSVGSNPYAVAVGDFNNDGFSDLATANRNSNNVSILLGNSAGGFGTATNFNVGSGPSSVALGDFNKDGKVDVATANQTSSNVSILLGNGAGNFDAATNFGVGSQPLSIAVGDLNGDGNLDLATANNSSNNASILLGIGTGSFNPVTNLSVGTNPQGVTLGDFNADGKLDLATANFGSNNVSILLNTPVVVNFGAPSYSSTEDSSDTIINIPVTLSETPLTDVTVPIAINPSSTATLGATNDYTLSATSLTFKAGATGAALTQNVAVTIKPDNIAENAETVVLNLGTITGAIAGTTATTTLTIEANDPIAYAIAANTASITEGNSGTTPVTFTVSRSGGTDAASSIDYAIGGTATNAADYNNIGGTSGATSPTGTINFAAGETSKTITMDVVGDTVIEANEDITVTLSNPVAPGPTPTLTTETATTTIINDDVPQPSFTTASNFVATSSLRNLAVGDFNKDGKLDVATASTGPNNVSVLLGNGAGSLGTATQLSEPQASATWAVAVGDFNGDGFSDLATANTYSNNVSIRLGTGTGSFGDATNLSVGDGPYSVAVGDFNKDGKLDLVTANQSANNVSILLGTGTGSFSAATDFQAGSSPYSVAVGDFNNDGFSDLATANRYSNNVSILLGTGTGSFGTATNFNVGDGPSSVALGDFNKDGKLDVATANQDANNVSILLGDGAGSFGAATNFGVGSQPLSIAVGDLNGDGNLDLATANNSSNDASILLGTGTGSFGTAANLSVGTNPQGVTLGDFNADGKLDLATANFGSNNVSILLNLDILVGGQVLEGTAGNDFLEGTAGNDLFNGGAGNDFLDGGAGNDQLFGQSGNDTLIGGQGNDFLDGGTGSDQLFGESGNDILIGGQGNDFLDGGTGSDTLNGGLGNDTLIGGSGIDKFTFNSPTDGIDTISDFNSGEGDQIIISASGFSGGLAVGNLPSSQFTIGSSAANASDRFIYNSSTGALFFDPDGNGSQGQVDLAVLSSNPALTSSNIFVVA